MGVVFTITLLPLIIAILGFLITMVIVGIVVSLVGMGGSIVSATALKDKTIKKVSLLFFVSVILIGLTCIAVLVGIFSVVSFFVAPVLALAGIIVIGMGIIGIIKAMGVPKKAPKITFTILLSLSSIIGTILLALGIIAFLFG